jgi:hypothetical protein
VAVRPAGAGRVRRLVLPVSRAAWAAATRVPVAPALARAAADLQSKEVGRGGVSPPPSAESAVMAKWLLVALLVCPLVGCDQDGPMENAGEKVDRAVDDAGDAIERNTDR